MIPPEQTGGQPHQPGIWPHLMAGSVTLSGPPPTVVRVGPARVSLTADQQDYLKRDLRASESLEGTQESHPVRKRRKITVPPGHHLLSISEFLFSPKIFETVLREIISDMRVEHAEALMRGRRYKAWWITVSGRWGFWNAFVHQSVFTGLKALFRWVGLAVR